MNFIRKLRKIQTNKNYVENLKTIFWMDREINFSKKNIFNSYNIKIYFLIIILPNNGGQRRSNFNFVFIFTI